LNSFERSNRWMLVCIRGGFGEWGDDEGKSARVVGVKGVTDRSVGETFGGGC
jgi:hypothetical protein